MYPSSRNGSESYFLDTSDEEELSAAWDFSNVMSAESKVESFFKN